MSHPFPDITCPPSAVYFETEESATPTPASTQSGSTNQWTLTGCQLSLEAIDSGDGFAIYVESETPLRRVILNWDQCFAQGTRLLGDAWERSYGELEWRGPSPHRLLPWYFMAHLGGKTTGYGVETGAASIASWQVDRNGIRLHLDLRAGGAGVRLGERRLLAAKVLQQGAAENESAYEATRRFCSRMSPKHLTPVEPIVGHNDWYWLYGKNSEALIVEATQRFMALYPDDTDLLPWSVIDDGWQTPPNLPGPHCNGGPWINQNPLFPDMAGLADKIKSAGARPGIWMRPLQTKADVPEEWQIKCPKPNSTEGGVSLDPTVPEVLNLITEDLRRIAGWGFEMIKHDFSTFDITGRWGFEMHASPMHFAPDGWTFHDSSKTTAEVITQLYRTIREAVGSQVMLIGCNTVDHLAAGLVEIQRIGDDTSASDWDRTRKMGVNTLAFRSVHQNTFYAADADCVPVSPHIPSQLTNQWLDLVARSGTPLFLSMDPAACDDSTDEAIRRALKDAVRPSEPACAHDWFDSPIPTHWTLQGEEAHFNWNEWARRS